MSTENSMVQKILVHQNQNQNRYCQPSPSIHIAHRFTLYILSTLCVHKIDTDTLKCTNEEILIKCPSFCQWFKPSKTGRKGNFIFGLIFLVAGITVHQYIGVLNCRNALSHCCHFWLCGCCVIERKWVKNLIHFHLNTTPRSMGHVGWFENCLPLSEEQSTLPREYQGLKV